MRNRSALAAGLTLLAGGCSGKEGAARSGASTGTPDSERRATLGGATVAGRVTLAGRPSENLVISMAEEPACRDDYPAPPRQEIVRVDPGGGLANVFVYVKAGIPADAQYPAPTTPVIVDQQGCMYHPRVLGIMVGQPLEIRNSDPLLHNIKATGKANRPFNISQPAAGMTTTRTFSVPEVMLPLECNVHGWMHAYVGVLPHPFFATTGTDGRFTIANLPAGAYEIEAWHEKYGARTATVTVPDSATKTIDFTHTAT